MTNIRLLHVDDEADIREVVEIALGLDAIFTVRNCGSGAEGLVVADDWLPDLILLDVMMPVMDGPATLARLRDNPKTAAIPVIFMTARAQTRELDRFRALGAVGVIAKPFDPMTLAESVRSYMCPVQDGLDELREGFLLRARKDATTLAVLRHSFSARRSDAATLAAIRQIAHGLAGAGGIFGFAEISDAAAALEDAVIDHTATPGLPEIIDQAIDHLIDCAEHCRSSPTRTVRLLENT
jgi:two-component system OmpR family response regulator